LAGPLSYGCFDDEARMLEKCANEKCDKKFRYFSVGLLYLAPRSAQNSKLGVNEAEFFWLCEKCARHEDTKAPERLPVIVGPASRRQFS